MTDLIVACLLAFLNKKIKKKFTLKGLKTKRSSLDQLRIRVTRIRGITKISVDNDKLDCRGQIELKMRDVYYHCLISNYIDNCVNVLNWLLDLEKE